MHCRGAAFLGLISSVFALVSLVQYIYVYVWRDSRKHQPHIPVVCVFAVIGVLGISVGLGSTVTFLGLGIVDSINHQGTYVTSRRNVSNSNITSSVSVKSLPETYYIGAVWAFGTFKWGLITFLHSLRTLRKLYKSRHDQIDGDADALISDGGGAKVINT